MSSDLSITNELYSTTYENHSSPSSFSPSIKLNSESITNSRKDSILKLPYPVLSDHRDLSSILVLLQKETQTTSKKISNVIQQIEECERHLTLNNHTDNEKKTFKYERVKFKQQLDALKKHERRVSLQIDFITTKNEIKGLEDEHNQSYENINSDDNQQIKILSGKLKQKLEKMKTYMKTRNEQMKKISNEKQINNHHRKSSLLSSQKQRVNSSSTKDSNRKRSSTTIHNSLTNKHSKLITPIVHLSSRGTHHNSKEYSNQPLIARFVDKTTDSTNNSTSPTTPASSSSTLSPPLLTKTIFQKNGLPSIDNDDELDLELNIDELFEDDSYADQTVQRLKTGINTNSYPLPVNCNCSQEKS